MYLINSKECIHNKGHFMRHYDVFICHASEDKDEIATALANELKLHGLEVWYDDFIFTSGDKLEETILKGLNRSRYGIVIISNHFFVKDWPKKELDWLSRREVDGRKVILPIWHNVTKEEVNNYSTELANTHALQSSDGILKVIENLIRVIDDGVYLTEEDIKAIDKSFKESNPLKMIYDRAEERGNYWEYTLKFNAPTNPFSIPTLKVVFYTYKSISPAKRRYPDAKNEDAKKVESWGQRLLVTDVSEESYGYTNRGRNKDVDWEVGVVVFRRYNLLIRIEHLYPIEPQIRRSIDKAEEYARIVDSRIITLMKDKRIEIPN